MDYLAPRLLNYGLFALDFWIMDYLILVNFTKYWAIFKILQQYVSDSTKCRETDTFGLFQILLDYRLFGQKTFGLQIIKDPPDRASNIQEVIIMITNLNFKIKKKLFKTPMNPLSLMLASHFNNY
jgi:hypothetical protein